VSLLRNIYYEIKPHVPVSLRLGVRQKLAGRILKNNWDTWPINVAAGRPPRNWSGWPENRKFALVLTHDVEGAAGLAKVKQLAELEMELGFRSSFNFIPEGSYEIPAELTEYLLKNGFEIGVHDLKHDGKLYRRRRDFQAAAEKINSYLRKWNASGFRSGFMHHNLDWMHELDIKYDMSTFDTDPFEPQPDGVDTIFPFWVPNPHQDSIRNPQSRSGYVELPYTLPQDSTLFLLLQESDTSIWKQKLDWIARKGGLALLNVHPDYMRFDEEPSARSYPVRFYSEFLNYVRDNYNGRYWHALPADVASCCSEFKLERAAASPKRVAMVSYSFYENDNRVMRYAEALADRGDKVDIFALSSSASPKKRETLNGVNVYRLQSRVKNEKGSFSYLTRLLRFLVRSSLRLTWKHLRQRYDVVHVHNVPDFLVFAAWLPRLTGSRVILDIHDIVPEFYASKFKTDLSNKWVRLLLRVEKLSCSFAHHVIISNHLWEKTLISRSVSPARCTTLVNYVDPEAFYPRPPTRADGKLIVIFPGGLQWHQGLDIAIRAFTKVSKALPNAEFHIYGDGDMKPSLEQLRNELKLHDAVFLHGPLPIREIPSLIANADLGIVPKRANSFGNEAYSTKIMEFMSQGIPVVAANTKIDTFYFPSDTVHFFESGNEHALADAIITVLTDKALAGRLREKGHSYIRVNNWSVKKREYFAITDGFERTRSEPNSVAQGQLSSPEHDIVLS
jgi:glycosyltransferase involved in cell wall biosynthesis